MNEDIGNVPAIISIGNKLEQIQSFYKDIVELDSKIHTVDYEEDLINLRDDANKLRPDFSIVYAKLLDKVDSLCDDCKHLQHYKYDREVDISCYKGHDAQLHPPVITCKDYQKELD